MKRILYAGGSVVTSDAVADVLLRYAVALANAGRADRVDVPAVDLEAQPTMMQLVIGPASQFAVEDSLYREQLDDRRSVLELEERIRSLTAPAG